MEERICLGCDVEIVPGPRERNRRRWCSAACRQRAKYRERKPLGLAIHRRCSVSYAECSECGCLFASQYPRTSCSEVCMLARKARVMRERYAVDPVKGAGRVRESRSAMTDEQKEAAIATRKAWLGSVGGRAESTRAADERRRARLVGVEYEKFSREEVFERDGWVCGICAHLISRELQYPDPLSPSLDHVTPISKGGSHTRANTRASHLICNIRRGNRVDDELVA